MGEKRKEERKSLRLQRFDYSSNRAYFVTVCTRNRQRLLCDIKKGIDGNDAVLIHASSQAKVSGLTKHHHRVGSDGRSVGATRQRKLELEQSGYDLFDIVGWFKSMVTNEYIRGVKAGKYLPFDKKLWQRGYYEHIIRNDDDLYEARRYVSENPVRWLIDGKEPFELNETKVE